LRRLWFKNPRPKIEKNIIKCELCGKEISVSSAVKRKRKHCSLQCSSMAQRKVERPSCEQLSEEIKNTSWVALGKKYGVSDRSVKKWAKQYGLLPSMPTV
jgi:transcription elongation factor Elf1